MYFENHTGIAHKILFISVLFIYLYFKVGTNYNGMSEEELNSYRFLSGEEPTDEMLHAIMSEARDVAVKKANEAEKRFEDDYEKQYQRTLSEWNSYIALSQNGQF
jgi:hypothetical protein